MYQVQFKSSGIVAYSHQERGMCQYFIDCNDYGLDKPLIDPETGEAIGYAKGDCLGLFTLVRVK
jgi:hypothetical protein